MLVEYDPEADALYVTLQYRERLAYGESLDPRRALHYDENGEVVAVEFLSVTKGIDLEGIPERERIIEAIRTFRRATADFATASLPH